MSVATLPDDEPKTPKNLKVRTRPASAAQPPFYQSEAVTILTLFVLPPVGLALMWLFQKWDALVKAAVSVVTVTAFVALFVAVNAKGQPAPVPAASPASIAASAAPASEAPASAAPATNLSSIATPVVSAPSAAAKPAVSAAAAPPLAVAAPASPVAKPSAAAPVAAKPAPVAAPPTAAANTDSDDAPFKLSSAQKADIQKLLDGNVTRLEQLLTAGKQVLGTTRYADSDAYSDALDDPKSPAVKFRDWRDNSNVDDDAPVSAALDKMDQIVPDPSDAFTLALGTWVDDIRDMQQNISDWTDVATDWQGRDKTDADLAKADKAVKDSAALVRKDITALLAKG